MARHAALQALLQRRQTEHLEASSRQQPLPGGSYGASTAGVRLAPDGSLDAVLELRHPDGRVEQVRFAAAPGEEPAEVPPWRPPASAPPSPTATGREAECEVDLRALAEAHLPSTAAAEFLRWLRPALRLRAAADGEAVVAQLGGLPALPLNSWPVWEGVGPLSHVLTVDLATAAPLLPELALPDVGSLAFFYYDGRYLDDVMTTVGTWDAATRHGARVVHLRPDLSTREQVTDLLTPAPPGLRPYPTVPLTGERILTWPSFELPWVADAWRRHGVAREDLDSLRDALGASPWNGFDTHQLGGHPTPQQGPVEYEVEQVRRAVDGEPFDWGDPAVVDALPRWRSLLQLASDERAEMMWGDVGQLHWLVRDDAPPQEASFTWQCG
ncbi:DUF1963 domain-containing protein [Nocardioides sp.]|uniref:DUF1963 domain-containing protein n=1 Tax=Nocardioides sp. TaxID=35761 RepID=UPI0035B3428D